MAISTPKTYRNQVLYSIFVRNFSPEGTFQAVERDLDRIKNLGVDIIWLMPIHPIGEVARKGTLGSPYAIRDYRAINPEYGTMEDFQHLVESIHQRGMKCIIDVVYNHTSPDSWLAANHPEWFYHKPDGSFGNRVGDWTDIIDLDYSNKALWDYQIETLKQWAEIVDGFRCDVAPLIPLEFWLQARTAVESVRPGCLWLSESVEPHFILDLRDQGIAALSDSEIFQAFDLSYEYDIYHLFKNYLEGSGTLETYTQAVNGQESTYPDNYVKLRFLENHDTLRARFLIPEKKALINWTAFLYFQKGMTMLYAGQEKAVQHLPNLFEKDTVCWEDGWDLTMLHQQLYTIKKHPLMTDSRYQVRAMGRDILSASHSRNGKKLLGIFSLRGEASLLPIDAPDGLYTNLIDSSTVEIRGGKLSCKGNPIVIYTE